MVVLKLKNVQFLIENVELLIKYDDISNKVTNSIKKEFDGAPIYYKKSLKTKINSYGDDATDAHDKEMAKIGQLNLSCNNIN